MDAESKSQTPTEGHPIAHIVCLLTKPHSQQNSDLNETQSNKPRELNRRRSLRVSIDRTSALRYISRVVRTQYLAPWLDGFDDRCNSRTSLDKDR